jgi:hypothetical protein
MAGHGAIEAVSRSLQALLLDRMTVPAAVTFAPPDVTVEGVGGARVNLYLIQLLENAGLKNQEIPGSGHPAAYGRPPLSLDLRYLVTTHSALENQPEADFNAQTVLGDAMRVLHDFGNRMHSLTMTQAVAGKAVGDPVIASELAGEFERIKLVLHPASLDDLTKVWSALGETNFRRSVLYEITVVQIETPEPRPRPRPVETRRVFATVRRRPHIVSACVSPAAGAPIGETRARIGDELTISAENALADRLYVRLGTLDPIRVPSPGDGVVRLIVPDDEYPLDLDHPTPPARPIPAAQQLQPGPLAVELIAVHPTEGVAGGLGPGATIAPDRRYRSNIALLQLVPAIDDVNPPSGDASIVLSVTGTRLWHPQARYAEVIIGDAALPIRLPGPGDSWAAPTPTAVQVPIADAAASLDTQVTGEPPYAVAVQVDGARSRDAVGFFLEA